MSNGTDQAQPPSEKLSLPVESRPKKRASPGDNWAPPPGWTTEEKVRTSGTKAGLVDKVLDRNLQISPLNIFFLVCLLIRIGIETD